MAKQPKALEQTSEFGVSPMPDGVHPTHPARLTLTEALAVNGWGHFLMLSVAPPGNSVPIWVAIPTLAGIVASVSFLH
jgi:hypothetical protein